MEKVNSLFVKERESSSFCVETMTNLIQGGADLSARRKFILSGNEHVEPFVHEELDREDLIKVGIENFFKTHKKYFEKGYVPKKNDMTSMFDARTQMAGVTNNWGMFLSTIGSQASDEQKSWWGPATFKGEMIGCYSQSECGHASNLRALQTTATYDPSTEEWVLNSPSTEAIKWWATGLPCSTHALVAAQLVTGGKQHGLHFFMVQLRQPNLEPMKGITLGDIGSLAGENTMPIGFMKFENCRIPRRCLLERRQHVTPSGEYKLEPEPKSMVNDGGAKKQKLSPAERQRIAYLTMLKTRIALASGAAGALSKAATIATRYSCARLQGFIDPSEHEKLANKAPEHQIIDYSVQRFRILRGISTAYAFRFATNWMIERRKQAVDSNDNIDLGDLPEVHASSSGLKAVSCVVAADLIEDLRRACGGHGYMNASGLAPLEKNFKGVHTTGEGDFVLLNLQLARFLMKQYNSARKGDKLVGLTECLAPLQDESYDPLAARKAASTKEDMKNMDFLLHLFQVRTVVGISRAGMQLKNLMENQGMPYQKAWNANARALYDSSNYHIHFFVLSKFYAMCHPKNNSSDKERDCFGILEKLCCFYALCDIVKGDGWVGILGFEEVGFAQAAIDEISLLLRPELLSLVDAFDFPDRSLNSALGRSDGNVYEALFESAQKSRLNKRSVPSFWDAIKEHLDFDLLKLDENGRQTLPSAKL